MIGCLIAALSMAMSLNPKVTDKLGGPRKRSTNSCNPDLFSSPPPSPAPAKPAPAPRKVSQKQLEYRAKMKQEKQEKEEYIAGRQEDLRKERSMQAKRRLEYLLKQGGNIFSHFGNVKEDTAKYGIKPMDRREGGEVTHRRGTGEEDDEQDAAALEEADEHEATFLTAQPSTLGFGKMRSYQLEGLNWMIRLQENGVNGILADGKTQSWSRRFARNQNFFSHFLPYLLVEMGLGKTVSRRSRV